MSKQSNLNNRLLIALLIILLSIELVISTPQSYSPPKYLLQTSGISYDSNLVNNPIAYSQGTNTLIYSNSSSNLIFLSKDSLSNYVQSSTWALPIGSLTISKLMVSNDLTRIFIQTNDSSFTVSTYNSGIFTFNPSGQFYYNIVDISKDGLSFISSATNTSQQTTHPVLVYKDSGSGYFPLTQFNYSPLQNAGSSFTYQNCVKFSKTSDSFLVFSFSSWGSIGSDYFNIYSYSLNSSASYSYVASSPGTAIQGVVQNMSNIKSNGSRLTWPSVVTEDDQIYGFSLGLNLNTVSYNSTHYEYMQSTSMNIGSLNQTKLLPVTCFSPNGIYLIVVYQSVGILYQLNRNTKRYVQVLQIGIPSVYRTQILINNAGQIFAADSNGIYTLTPSDNASLFASPSSTSNSNTEGNVFSSINQQSMAVIAIAGLVVAILSFLFVILMLCCYKTSKQKQIANSDVRWLQSDSIQPSKDTFSRKDSSKRRLDQSKLNLQNLAGGNIEIIQFQQR